MNSYTVTVGYQGEKAAKKIARAAARLFNEMGIDAAVQADGLTILADGTVAEIISCVRQCQAETSAD